MTQHIRVSALVLVTLFGANLSGDWKPVPGRIITQSPDDVDPANPLAEYPRPQLVRNHWVNLNGLWDYAVTRVNDPQPTEFEGQILVPFCIESAFSGVKRQFTPNDRLWYSRSFDAPSLAEGERLRLNFGAVDYEATVLVNGKQVGTHKGGYDSFSFDITDAAQPGENTLVVSVLDAQNGPKGRQSVGAFDNPRFIFYTATSGIWQTVWLEKVPANQVSSLKITPNIDQETVAVTVFADAGTAHVTVKDGDKIVSQAQGKPGAAIVLDVPDAKLWSPESPLLYDLEITLGDDKVHPDIPIFLGANTGHGKKGHPQLERDEENKAAFLLRHFFPEKVDGPLLSPTVVERVTENGILEVTVRFPAGSGEESGRIWWMYDRAPDGSPRYLSELIPDANAAEKIHDPERGEWTVEIKRNSDASRIDFFSNHRKTVHYVGKAYATYLSCPYTRLELGK